jgi:hypothetical protein
VPDGNFSSPKELGKILARSRDCQDCIVKQLFRYAYGRHETDRDKPLLDKASALFRSSEFRLKEVMGFLAKSLAYNDPVRGALP